MQLSVFAFPSAIKKTDMVIFETNLTVFLGYLETLSSLHSVTPNRWRLGRLRVDSTWKEVIA
jgi:hypothetical protein